MKRLIVVYNIFVVEQYLSELAEKFDINRDLVERLRSLEEYEIVILCDDSGSMTTRINGTGKTRWQELQEIVKIALQIGTVFDENGVDIYFLNRPALRKVTDPSVIEKEFNKRPRGFSRLAPALKYIFGLDAAKPGGDKKLLVFVATDAEPTNEDDKVDLTSLEKVMREGRDSETTHVMFLLCSDNSKCFDYLSKWDINMKNVDFALNFEREKERVHKCHGNDFPFSFGDYIVRSLLGAIDPEIDGFNEEKA